MMYGQPGDCEIKRPCPLLPFRPSECEVHATMKPVTKLFVVAGLVVGITPTVLSQDSPSSPIPLPPSSDAIGAQLIAWSELQKPQPLSEVAESETSERADLSDLKNTPAVRGVLSSAVHSSVVHSSVVQPSGARSQATEQVPNSQSRQNASVK